MLAVCRDTDSSVGIYCDINHSPHRRNKEHQQLYVLNFKGETDKDPTRARALYTTGKPSGNNHSQLRKYNGVKV